MIDSSDLYDEHYFSIALDQIQSFAVQDLSNQFIVIASCIGVTLRADQDL